MKSERYEMRMAGELLAAIDSQRGQLSRAAWITKVLEAALRHGADSAGSVPRPVARPPSASPRTPVVGRAKPKPRSYTEAEAEEAKQHPVEGTPLPKIAPRRAPR